MKDREAQQYIFFYVKKTLNEIMEEIGRLSKDVHTVKKRQQRTRSMQRKKEPSILSYRSRSVIDRRLKEIENIHKGHVRSADTSRGRD